MAVVKKDTLSVVPASSVTVVFKKKPQKILDEDTYTKVNLVLRSCQIKNPVYTLSKQSVVSIAHTCVFCRNDIVNRLENHLTEF